MAHNERMSSYRAMAEFYDAEYDADPQTADDAAFLIGQLPKKSQRILELGVGTGRLAIPLAQAGHKVTGVDNAADVLAVAKRKRDAVGLSDAQLNLRRSSIERLSLGQTFDHAVIVFNTFLLFTTLPQQMKVLSAIRNHLSPGGSLWIDIFNPDLSILAEPEIVDMQPLTFFVDSLGLTVSKTTSVRRMQSQVQEVTFHYQWFEPDGTHKQEHVSFELTWMMPRELLLLLDSAGFRTRLMCGDYDGSVVLPDSPRLIVRATRED